MYLKRIELHGFKTFATRSVIDLRPGIAAIVGPNGSGKSNVADAVRWALGETNLRQVRCKETQELIFAGGGRRASLGMADVSLIFANEDGWLNLPFSEVRVARRAYRTGENEYSLNGSRVRLREVADLLAGASIHAGGHVVVGQGMVDAVLAQRAEDRRALVEQLAGLKQYYLRRDDAESRLAATEANAAQVLLLIDELAPQVETLAAQALALRSARDAESELRALHRARFGMQARRLLVRAADTATALEHAERERQAAREAAEVARAEDGALLEQARRQQAMLSESQALLHREQAHLAEARREGAVAAARQGAALQARRAATTEIERLTVRAAECRAALDEAERRTEAQRATVVTTANEGERRRAALRERRRERDGALEVHRREEETLAAAARRATDATQAAALAAARAESALEELSRQRALLATAERARATADEAKIRAERAAAEARAAHEAARADHASALARLEHRTGIERAHRRALDDTRRREHETSVRLDALRQVQEGREGYNDTTRALAALPGARGIVAEVLIVQPDYQPPVAAVLGPLSEAVLAERPGSLAAAPAAAGDGQARVLGLAAEPDARERTDAEERIDRLLAEGTLGTDEVIGRLSELVATSVPGAIERLGLHRVLLVRSDAAALRCRAHAVRHGLTVAAVSGAVVAFADGTLGIGSPSTGSAALQRRSLLGHLADELDGLVREAAGQEVALDAARRDVADADCAAHRGRAEVETTAGALTRARDEARFQERMIAQSHQDAAGARQTVDRLVAELEGYERQRDAEQGRLSVATSDRDAAQRRLAQLRADLSAADGRVSSALAELREHDAALSAGRAALDAALQVCAERSRANVAAEDDLARHHVQGRRADLDLRESLAALATLRGREEAAEASTAAIEARIAPMRADLEAILARQAAVRTVAADAEVRRTQAERDHDRARSTADAVQRDLEVLRAQVAAEVRCTLQELPDIAPPANAPARMQALRKQLAAIGPVNARAEDDHAAMAARLAFLTMQAADLRDGVARLRAIIAEANTTVRERFGATVERMNEHFSAFFERLFAGGSSRLLALYDAQGLPAGMQVEAQPPGKRTRELALLSGGERALVALALLFAMLKVRPVPFCLLDEVEAALDESNTGRFGAILRELAEVTQFIVITHNRGTMLHADSIFGVTLNESGVSSLLSIALSRDDLGQITLERSGS